MSFIKNYQKKILVKNGFSDKFIKNFFKFHFFIWSIAKGITGILIAYRILDRIGFEKTVVLQLVILLFMFRSFFKKSELKEKELI